LDHRKHFEPGQPIRAKKYKSCRTIRKLGQHHQFDSLAGLSQKITFVGDVMMGDC
jgi:hypothetical protein